jgi:hypothetical protein
LVNKSSWQLFRNEVLSFTTLYFGYVPRKIVTPGIEISPLEFFEGSFIHSFLLIYCSISNIAHSLSGLASDRWIALVEEEDAVWIGHFSAAAASANTLPLALLLDLAKAMMTTDVGEVYVLVASLGFKYIHQMANRSMPAFYGGIARFMMCTGISLLEVRYQRCCYPHTLDVHPLKLTFL